MSTLSLACMLRQRILQSKAHIQCTRRWFAEVVNSTPNSSNPEEVSLPMSLVDRRKHRVPVREDHGLWAFFRRREPEDGKELKGEAKYMICETPQTFTELSGRGWKAEELRLKSFKDLHTLWYVLLRERNLLATQKEEIRRVGVTDAGQQVNGRKVYHVRKSMARIKQVLNERRLAYEKAYDIASAEQEAYHNEQVLTHLRGMRRRRLATRAAVQTTTQDVAGQVQDKTAVEPIVEARQVVEKSAAQTVVGLPEAEEKLIVEPDVVVPKVRETTVV